MCELYRQNNIDLMFLDKNWLVREALLAVPTINERVLEVVEIQF